jgi:hypothetical protein
MNDMGMQTGYSLNLVVALPAEAKPIIRLLNLKRDQVNMDMPVFYSGHIQLVISGPGVQASTDGVHYLHSVRPVATAQWLNIGICGHGSLEVGAALLAERIIDRQTGRRWSLTPPQKTTCTIGALTCVAEPQAEYAIDMAYDMESSGFIDTVSTVASIESARVFKIVSDNPANDIRGINAKRVGRLIEQQCELIRSMIELI